MKLEINLDESRFKDLVDEELGKFNEEEIHDILGKAISQYVMDGEVIQKLFYVKKRNYYGQETGEIEPTNRLEKIINNLDVESVLDGVKTRVQEVINQDDFIKKMAENLFYHFIAGRLGDLMWRNGELATIIQRKANEVVDSRLNNR